MKCTLYGIYGQVTFKNARAIFFSNLGGAGSSFWSGSKILNSFLEAAAALVHLPLKARRGRFDIPHS